VVETANIEHIPTAYTHTPTRARVEADEAIRRARLGAAMYSAIRWTRPLHVGLAWCPSGTSNPASYP